MSDVQIMLNVNGKQVPFTVPENTQFAGDQGNLQVAKKGSIINMTREQYSALMQIAGMDGKKNLSAADLEKFNSLPAWKQTNLINSALSKADSEYRVGTVRAADDQDGRIHTRSNSASINMTPDGETLEEYDSCAKFFGVYLQNKDK